MTFWNVDAKWSSSDSWKGFTKFTLMKEKHPKGYMWSRKRLTKIQTTTRPENLWPEVWEERKARMGNREAKTFLCSMLLKDWEALTSSIRKMVNMKKPSKTQGTVGRSNGGRVALQKWNKEALRVSGNWSEEWWFQQDSKDKACMHRGDLNRKIIKDHIAGKGYNSMTRYNLVHEFMPMPQAMKIPEAESKKEVILEAQRGKKESPLCYIDGHLSSQKMRS